MLPQDILERLAEFLTDSESLFLHEVAHALFPQPTLNSSASLCDACLACDPFAVVVSLRCGAAGRPDRAPYESLFQAVSVSKAIAQIFSSSVQMKLNSARKVAQLLDMRQVGVFTAVARAWLSEAVISGNGFLVESLVHVAADINQQDPEMGQSTPLMLAIGSSLFPSKKLELCHTLLELRADASSEARRADGACAADVLRVSKRPGLGWRKIEDLLLQHF
mmetsp:Transcript_5637/g.9103  ORF Transcript_5637/g.9103 Transcript_5637/m.9103 type:complete len:221 (+) Transcript_5637:76-738(+)